VVPCLTPHKGLLRICSAEDPVALEPMEWDWDGSLPQTQHNIDTCTPLWALSQSPSPFLKLFSRGGGGSPGLDTTCSVSPFSLSDRCGRLRHGSEGGDGVCGGGGGGRGGVSLYQPAHPQPQRLVSTAPSPVSSSLLFKLTWNSFS
jgi:hypothetical protein